MSHFIRRALVAGAVTAIGSVGATLPVHAEETSPVACDPAVVAAVETARADARAAQQAFTSFSKGSAQAQGKRLQDAELREARKAAKSADRLADKAAKGEKGDKAARAEARAAAKVAREVARVEAKQAKAVQRASRGELRDLAKAEKKQLKADWDAAKDVLEDARKAAEGCDEAVVEPELPEIELPEIGELIA